MRPPEPSLALPAPAPAGRRGRVRVMLRDPLVRNAVMLLAMGGLTAMFGFGFWLLNARLYSPGDIGLASTLLSGMTLLSYLSLFGMNNLIIRHAAREDAAQLISSAVIVVAAVSLVGAAVYLVVLQRTSPGLVGLLDSTPKLIMFLLVCVAMGVNVVTDSAFVARRAAHYNLLVNALLQGSLKLLLTVAMVGLGAFGLVAASGASVAVCAVVSLVLIDRRLRLPVRPRVVWATLREGAWFSATTYVSSALQLVPPLVVPLILLDRRGEADAGFYFIAFQIASLVFVAADAVGESLFAEHAHGRDPREVLRRSGLVLAALTCGLALAVWVISPWVLRAFGGSYLQHGLPPLQMLLIGAVPVALSVWSSFLLKSRGRVLRLLTTKVVFVLVIVGATVAWADRGLVWVAAAYGLGNLAAALAAAPVRSLSRAARRAAPRAARPPGGSR